MYNKPFSYRLFFFSLSFTVIYISREITQNLLLLQSPQTNLIKSKTVLKLYSHKLVSVLIFCHIFFLLFPLESNYNSGLHVNAFLIW